MKKFALLSVIVGMTLTSPVFGGSQAGKTKPTDLLRIVTCIKTGRTETGKQFLLRKQYDVGGMEVVFVYSGKRYTVYYTNDPQILFLSFWVRPNGTQGQKSIITFSDNGLDGVVDFGLQDRSAPGGGKYMSLTSQEGHAEYRAYWQQQYDDAVRATLSYLQSKK